MANKKKNKIEDKKMYKRALNEIYLKTDKRKIILMT